MGQQTERAPLAGVRVLDLAPGPLGAVGRLLLELGADVVRVEPPGGGVDRTAGVTAGGVALGFAAANLGKRAVALDLTAADDRRTLDSLAASADILIEATRPGDAEAAALNVVALRKAHPGLVILSLREFGEGSLAEWRGSDLVLHALSGELSRSGNVGREPLPPPGELALQCAAAHGAYAVLLGYLQRLQTGEGDHLELSLLEATTQVLDPGFGIAGSATSGIPASRLPRARPVGQDRYPVYRCKDGYVRFCILAARQWQGLFEWMGRPEEFADPAFNQMRHRQTSKRLHEVMAAFVADKTRAELEAESHPYRVPLAGVLSIEDVVASDHMSVRNALAKFEVAPGVEATFPNGVLEVDGRRAAAQGPPPALGGGAEQVLTDWSKPRTEADASAVPGQAGRPLAGLRVLDLGVIVVGAEQGRLLADYGAEVIKVENAAFPDGSRASSLDLMPVTFAAGHRNKLGLGLNLRDPKGKELLLDLAAKADVILSNFKPGTLESLGLGPEVFHARNPDLILADSSAFGATGPWGHRMGYGPLVRCSAGLTAVWRYPDDPEGFCDGITSYPDHVSARIGAVGVLALLVRRIRAGGGGRVSVSQAEVMLANLPERVAAASLSAADASTAGVERDAPYDAYPCAGDDEWCAVGVRNDAEWRALCAVIGRNDLASNAALDTAAGRDAHRELIDQAVAGWLASRTPDDAMRQLQAGGVPAGAMLRVVELPGFGFFRERGFFEQLHQAHVPEPITVDNAPVRSKRLARPPLRSAPIIGEHSAQIARELLGLGEAEIAQLLEQGVLEVDPRTPARETPSDRSVETA